MPWADVPRGKTAKPRLRPGVHAAMTHIGSRKWPALFLLWIDAPEWTLGGVSVAVGTGADAGRLRITKTGEPGQGKKKNGNLRLFLTNIPDLPKPPIASAPCQVEMDGESAIVTLPAWMRPAAEPRATLADVVMPQPAPPPPKPAAPVKPAVAPAARAAMSMLAASTGVPEFMTTAQAIRWGAERGIPGPKLDLAAINAKRRKLGLPVVMIEG